MQCGWLSRSSRSYGTRSLFSGSTGHLQLHGISDDRCGRFRHRGEVGRARVGSAEPRGSVPRESARPCSRATRTRTRTPARLSGHAAVAHPARHRRGVQVRGAATGGWATLLPWPQVVEQPLVHALSDGAPLQEDEGVHDRLQRDAERGDHLKGQRGDLTGRGHLRARVMRSAGVA